MTDVSMERVVQAVSADPIGACRDAFTVAMLVFFTFVGVKLAYRGARRAARGARAAARYAFVSPPRPLSPRAARLMSVMSPIADRWSTSSLPTMSTGSVDDLTVLIEAPAAGDVTIKVKGVDVLYDLPPHEVALLKQTVRQLLKALTVMHRERLLGLDRPTVAPDQCLPPAPRPSEAFFPSVPSVPPPASCGEFDGLAVTTTTRGPVPVVDLIARPICGSASSAHTKAFDAYVVVHGYGSPRLIAYDLTETEFRDLVLRNRETGLATTKGFIRAVSSKA